MAARRQWRLVLAVIGVAVVAATIGAVSILALGWTESAAFCGQCHTMKPELEAYERGPHRDVKCGECHVGPGLVSFIKSKLNGTRQMFQILTGTYPAPIRPSPHSVPSPDQVCGRCHSPGQGQRDLILIRSRFAEDENNSEQRVGLAVRLSSINPWGAGRIHGHNELKIQYIARGEGKQSIDWIRVERPDGTADEYIAQQVVGISNLVGPQVEAMKSQLHIYEFGCVDCHNRVGHEFVPPDRALDDALAQGRIDRHLPYVKREGLRILTAEYTSREEAEAAMASLADFYAANYPAVYQKQREQIEEAIDVLREIYEESASPEMRASYKVYPSNLGHRNGRGCFRCHDGAHLRIQDGRVTKEPLAWECSTCHTFPVWGSDVLSIPINQPPQYHSQALWLFKHKEEAVVESPVPAPCSNCHTVTFCTSCHATGVRHDEMLFSHASLARERGTQTCSFCHQEVYCAQCHER